MTQPKMLARLITAAGATLLALALFAPGASAKEPNAGYTQFAGCPSPEENSSVVLCIRTDVTGGHLQMGSKDTPISNPMVLSGGITNIGKFVFNSKGGLPPVKQTVPGGVVGLTGLTWLLEFFGINALSLYAETELAGEAHPLSEPIVLPIKVHLTTPSGVLGKNCYVGSTANPITLNLTGGTTSPPPPNEPITGSNGESVFDTELKIFHINNAELVDNAFAAPGASGCVLTLFGFIPISINGLVNSQSGLPSPAGTNETRQDSDIQFAERVFVY